ESRALWHPCDGTWKASCYTRDCEQDAHAVDPRFTPASGDDDCSQTAGVAMIRKLKSGEFRLYSRKKDPKTGKRRNLGTFKSLAARAERREHRSARVQLRRAAGHDHE